MATQNLEVQKAWYNKSTILPAATKKQDMLGHTQFPIGLSISLRLQLCFERNEKEQLITP